MNEWGFVSQESFVGIGKSASFNKLKSMRAYVREERLLLSNPLPSKLGVTCHIKMTTTMIQNYPNPWEFHNTDKTLVSADNNHKVVFYDLNEIAMGAPIGGQCFLENSDKKKIKIHDWCGGPPAWETAGQLLAIPVWTRKLLKGTVQQIGVLDTRIMELKIFKKTFRVLDIRSFDKMTIYGYDSPNHKTEIVTFDIVKEKIETIIKLT